MDEIVCDYYDNTGFKISFFILFISSVFHFMPQEALR